MAPLPSAPPALRPRPPRHQAPARRPPCTVSCACLWCVPVPCSAPTFPQVLAHPGIITSLWHFTGIIRILCHPTDFLQCGGLTDAEARVLPPWPYAAVEVGNPLPPSTPCRGPRGGEALPTGPTPRAEHWMLPWRWAIPSLPVPPAGVRGGVRSRPWAPPHNQSISLPVVLLQVVLPV